jgi:stage II sporulation protein D
LYTTHEGAAVPWQDAPVRCLAAALALFAAALLPARGARAEEIRIELLRGARRARISGHLLSAQGQALLVDGAPAPFSTLAARLEEPGQPRELPGRVDAFAENGTITLVNTLDLEDYVAAVVASEVPASWPEAALQAQAVAARTFAVAQKIAQGPGAQAHLRSTVLDQVYGGAAHPASGALKAAKATSGEVLTWGAAPIAAYFSASCGGASESGEAGFNLAPGTAPYLVAGVEDLDERPWTLKLPLAQLSATLRKAGRGQAPVGSISIASRTKSGRARTLKLGGGRTINAVELRQLVGYERLRSLLFDVRVSGGEAIFTGRGSGHGVGLCQWGARERAQRGDGYRKILEHYYPGAEIRRMY